LAHVQAIAAPDKRLALEESNLARWLWQLLRPHVAQLVVCDARHNKLISAHHNKKDPRDAFGLARLFRLNELKPVWQGSATHARLNTQRKLLRAWWTMWLEGKEWEKKSFSRPPNINDVERAPCGAQG